MIRIHRRHWKSSETLGLLQSNLAQLKHAGLTKTQVRSDEGSCLY